MFISIVLTQLIVWGIFSLFILQRNGRLEKTEKTGFSKWLILLFILNYIVICASLLEITSFTLLMMASANGLLTILYIFTQNFIRN
ncbi:MAG: hypothetical protein RR554_02785 [Vagococcus sp.]|uniref:hypothetical protein n=1 Tax=Vagococcus sp. TaxID=1933889 RepID=UPI002FC5DD24